MYHGLYLVLSMLLGHPALAGTDSRAEELARLRREVETLSADLAEAKDDTRTRLRAIDAQKAEIDVQLRRESLRLAQVQGEMEARRAELAAHQGRATSLAPAVQAAIGALRRVVETGLPYHLAERLGELDRLSSQLADGAIRPEAAASRLWAFTEDEMRLAKENGLDRQVIAVDGSEMLADVARLGMVALYFRTEGGQVGVVRHEAGAWRWVTLGERREQLAVETLFDKLKHGVRTGAFELPNPYTSSTP